MTRTTERDDTLPRAKRSAPSTIELTRSIDIAADPHQVFGYVTDFSRAREWRTEVVESTMSPAGPMQAGSRLREVAIAGGRRVITESVIETFEPLHRFTFEHVSGPLPVSGEYRVEPRPSGPGKAESTLHYTLRVQLVGAWRLMTPLLRLTAPRTVSRSLRRLADHLEEGTS